MREFTFDLVFDQGFNRVTDVFRDHPGLRLQSLVCHAATDRLLRLDRITGPEPALESAEDVFLDTDDCNYCPEGACSGRRRYEVLSREGDRRNVYTYQRSSPQCRAIPIIATRILGGGLLFENDRNADRSRWRIVMADDKKVGIFYDVIHARLVEGIEFKFGHHTNATKWPESSNPAPNLSSVQRTAIEAAMDKGYYETPGEITASELAEDLELPQSTLTYRLRRAEAQIVTTFLEGQA